MALVPSGGGQHGALVIPEGEANTMAAQMLTQRFRDEQNADVHLETARVYPHMEWVKLWGWRDEHLHLPTSSSVTVNLKERERAVSGGGGGAVAKNGRLHVDATVAVSDKFVRDRMWVNGEEVPVDVT